VEECLACDVISGSVAAPGGRILETDHWVVDHSVGSLGVGTLIVKPYRHVVRVGELNDDEARELGPRLQAAMFARGEPPDLTAAAAFAEHARALLG
jgi:diadenosine tetraphosphate (Ap4A) HIT family hydrolase